MSSIAEPPTVRCATSENNDTDWVDWLAVSEDYEQELRLSMQENQTDVSRDKCAVMPNMRDLKHDSLNIYPSSHGYIVRNFRIRWPRALVTLDRDECGIPIRTAELKVPRNSHRNLDKVAYCWK